MLAGHMLGVIFSSAPGFSLISPTVKENGIGGSYVACDEQTHALGLLSTVVTR